MDPRTHGSTDPQIPDSSTDPPLVHHRSTGLMDPQSHRVLVTHLPRTCSHHSICCWGHGCELDTHVVSGHSKNLETNQIKPNQTPCSFFKSKLHQFTNDWFAWTWNLLNQLDEQTASIFMMQFGETWHDKLPVNKNKNQPKDWGMHLRKELLLRYY